MPSTTPTPVGKLADGIHHGRELGNGASAQVIAEGEAAGNYDDIAILQVVRFMPEECSLLIHHVLGGPEGIVIAVGSGENYDAEFHWKPPSQYTATVVRMTYYGSLYRQPR
jgi:hypothetical protein